MSEATRQEKARWVVRYRAHPDEPWDIAYVGLESAARSAYKMLLLENDLAGAEFGAQLLNPAGQVSRHFGDQS